MDNHRFMSSSTLKHGDESEQQYIADKEDDKRIISSSSSQYRCPNCDMDFADQKSLLVHESKFCAMYNTYYHNENSSKIGNSQHRYYSEDKTYEDRKMNNGRAALKSAKQTREAASVFRA